MGMSVVLCALSEKRIALLEEDPGLLSELLSMSQEGDEVPGLLDIGKTWDALDFILSDQGKDAVLGDALLGRTGRKLRAAGAYGKARLLGPSRVAEVDKALSKLPAQVVRDRYPELFGKDIHGDFGQETCAEDEIKYIKDKVRETRESETAHLESVLAAIRALYKRASDEGHSMMSVIV